MMPTAIPPDLPAPGFAVRLRSDVRRLRGGNVLVGGSPVRALRLSRPALDLVDSGTVVVRDPVSWRVARQLLDGNLADPVPGHPLPAEEITVVVPVRDRATQLDRTLAALHGLQVVVVDDASERPTDVHAVAARHGAQLVMLDRNLGPAGARNAGMARVRTPFVAFVDSDVTVDAHTLQGLAGHFADPRVALVAPRIRGVARTSSPRWFERYDVAASSLTLGNRPCSVRPGAAVAWLPSACLVGRVAALGAGFEATMRVGEDVDLVWRLVDTGWVVRYDPTWDAAHDVRGTVASWLGRKAVYGTGSAALAARHGSAVAPAILSPGMAVAAALLLSRSRWALPVVGAALAASTVRVRRALPDTPDRSTTATRLSAIGLSWAVRQEAALALRHWWPLAAALAPWSGAVRRGIATALAVDTIVGRVVDGVDVGLPTLIAGRRLDDLAYGAGLWVGAIRAGDPRCLVPRVVGWSRPRGQGRQAAPGRASQR